MASRVALLQQQATKVVPPPLDAEAPATPVDVDVTWPPIRQALVGVYNRIGGHIERQAEQAGIDVPSVLAVWYVESGGRSHTPGQAVIRFENHILFNQWGAQNPDLYDQHFQHGGRAPALDDACRGPSGEYALSRCHAYRRTTSGPFTTCHSGQSQEYDVLSLARELAGDAIALQCISIGGCQVMGFNYQKLGFQNPLEMYDAFQATESAQVDGFFSFCSHCGQPGQAVASLQQHDWETFARLYNGTGNVASYASQLRGAVAEARQFWPPLAEPQQSRDDYADQLLTYARSLTGVPYEINLDGFPRVPGGRGFGKKYPNLDKGLDCSGFVLNVLQHMGQLTDLDPDYTGCDGLWAQCQSVGQADARRGDLVFFKATYETTGLSHIGLVTEDGGMAMISARTPGVSEDDLSAQYWQNHLAGFGRLRRKATP
jgi:cell wall-associated NlpC family hydrolase